MYDKIYQNLNMQDKKQTEKHLEKIYNNKIHSKKFVKNFKDQFNDKMKESPSILMIIKLLILANIGIWLTLVAVFQTH